MLVISRQQMEVFSQAPLEAFETEMVAHCREFSPRLCEVIGEAQLRVAIRGAIDRAGRYGFTHRGPVRLFIELALLFGSAFDTDPQYSWTKAILDERDSKFQMRRAERLHEKTLDYLDRVVGPDDQFVLRALERIAALARESPMFSQEDLAAELLRETASIYPEKAGYIGDDALRLLIREGMDEAAAHGLLTGRGRALLCVLMFAFGHGCTHDPLYPWIERTLKDERIVDPASRARRLEKKALTWLDHVIAWHKERARP